MPGAGDPDNRRMMRFGDDLGGLEQATLAWVQTLGQVRAAHPSLSRGQWSAPLLATWDTLAWARTTDEETAVVVLNLGDSAQAGELPTGSVGVSDGVTFTDVLGDAGAATSAGGTLSWSLPARSAAIFVGSP